MSPLPCGHSVDDLVAHLAGDAPELAAHVAACPHCAARLAELERRWSAVRETAVTPVPTPPGLVERVLAAVRGVRPRPAGAPVEVDREGGRTSVAERAVLAVCRQAAVDLAGDLGLHVRATAVEDGELQVLVTARYPAPAVVAADDLRTALDRELRARLGVALVVHVHLIDVH